MLERTNQSTSIQQDREDLSSAIRLAAHFDFHEGICNHFSVQCEGSEELYLINSYGWHWSEVTADRLLLINGDGEVVEGDGEVELSARNIHISSHRANPRHKAIFHVHMPYATSISMLKKGRLLMAHQTATRFHGRIAYQDRFGGIATTKEEGERIAEKAKSNSQIDCLFLANHGVVCSGRSVAEAFDDLYYLERAAKQQVLAQSTGLPLQIIPEDVVEHTAEQFKNDFAIYAGKHFEALKRLV